MVADEQVRAEQLYLSALSYVGPEKEYLGLLQGLSDAWCELMILRDYSLDLGRS